MLIHNADITGSLTINGTRFNTGSFSGSFTGAVAGTTATASYVEYNNVANKPALVSGSSQITYSGLTGIPSGIVSGSAQVAGFGIFATTGSNQFNGSQSITGSLTVTGQVVAQTLNVQQVTSSIVYSSGSNIFGNSLANIQQFTGSVSITGSLNTSIAAFGSAASLYLVSDGGTIKSRTAAQTLSDIAALPLAGGTLTGPLTGSSAVFSGDVSITKDNPKLILNDNTGGSQNNYSISSNFGFFNLNDETAAGASVMSYGGGLFNFTGAATFSNSVTAAGNIFTTNDAVFSTAGSITRHATVGLVLRGVTASVFDLALYSANGTALMTNQTGTNNINFNSGNLGLAVTSPGNFSGLTFTGPFLDVAGIMQIKGTSANTIAALQFGGDTFRKALIYSSIGTEDPYLGFSVSSSGNSSFSPERMRITSGGNVGIGTSSPSTRLDIANGTLTLPTLRGRTYQLSNVSSANPNFITGTGFNSIPVRVGDIIDLPFGQTRTVVAVTDTVLTVDAAWTVSFGGSTVDGRGGIVFETNNAERMRIPSMQGAIAFNNNGSATGLYSQAVATAPGTNYYFNFLEALNNASAASIKVGGILASDSYGIANPDRGDIYVQDTVSAATFVDRTPYPSSLELAKDVVKSHRRRSEEEIEELVVTAYNKIQNLEKEMPQPEKEALTFEEYKAKYRKEYELDHSVLHDYVNDTRYAADGIESRDLSATVSCLVEVVKDLIGKVETLESEIQTLKQQ